jgi:hypothetical protein
MDQQTKKKDDRQTSRGRMRGRQAEWQAENRKGEQQQTGGRKVVCLEEATNWQRGRQTSKWSGGMHADRQEAELLVQADEGWAEEGA